jgi:UDP-N-acetylmuramate-alanine ligase
MNEALMEKGIKVNVTKTKVLVFERDERMTTFEECGVKEDVVTIIEKNMMRWFGHVERMDEMRLTKEISEVNLSGNAGRGPRRSFLDQTTQVLEKGQVKSTQNRRVKVEVDKSERSERCGSWQVEGSDLCLP